MKQSHQSHHFQSCKRSSRLRDSRPGLVGDDALVHLVQVGPHADGQPFSQLAAVHGVHHPEHLSPGEAQADGRVRLVIEVGADVEVVGQVGLDDLLVN